MRLKGNSLKISLIIGLLPLLPVAVQAQFSYQSDGIEITITGFNGAGAGIIPSTTNGLPVTGIEGDAFANSQLTSIVIPATVTNIGDYAFNACLDLTNITVSANNPAYASAGSVLFDKNLNTLVAYPDGRGGSYIVPNSVTSIVDQAFSAARISQVTISNSVLSIGDSAFGLCGKLTNIAVSASNPACSSLGGVLFDKNRTTIIQYPNGLGGCYTVPSTVALIGDGAFANDLLTGISIPDSVTSIDDSSFTFCENLANVTLPNSITNLGDDAFENCFNLAKVALSTNLTSLNYAVFFECYELYQGPNILFFRYHGVGDHLRRIEHGRFTRIADQQHRSATGRFRLHNYGNQQSGDCDSRLYQPR